MLITIDEVLNQEELGVARDLISRGQFIDGKLTAGSEATRVKNNAEFSPDNQLVTPLNNLVMGKLVQNETYLAAAFPKQIAAPIFARYTKGMNYGNHIDDPLMGPAGQRFRSDVSITVFLNEPDDYEGGELVITTQYGDHQVKLKAGDAVLYPSSSTHRVNTVTSGERLVAVTWLQSMIKDPAQRELLYNLHLAREDLLHNQASSETTERVSNTYVNLVRMWSDV